MILIVRVLPAPYNEIQCHSALQLQRVSARKKAEYIRRLMQARAFSRLLYGTLLVVAYPCVPLLIEAKAFLEQHGKFSIKERWKE